jgi:hypothetical protein
VYSGALLRTLPGAFGTLRSMVISEDGTALYALDTGSGAGAAQIRVLDPDLGTERTPLTASRNTLQGQGSLAFARPDGVGVLLSTMTSDAFVHQAGTPYPLLVEGPAVTVRGDQRVVYTQNTGFSPSTLHVYRMRFSGLPGNPGLKVSSLATNLGNETGYVRSNGSDVALSADGTKLYVAAGSPYRFDVLNPATLAVTGSLAGNPFPTNVETCWNGRLVGGIDDSSASPGDLYVYDAAGTLVTNLDSGAQSTQVRNLRFSGDCTRLISPTAAGVRIQNAP